MQKNCTKSYFLTVKSNFLVTRANTPFSVTVIVIGCSTPEEVRRASSGTEICLLSLVCEWKHTAFSVLCSLLTCSIFVSVNYEKPMQQKCMIEVHFAGTNIYAFEEPPYFHACHKMFGGLAPSPGNAIPLDWSWVAWLWKVSQPPVLFHNRRRSSRKLHTRNNYFASV